MKFYSGLDPCWREKCQSLTLPFEILSDRVCSRGQESSSHREASCEQFSSQRPQDSSIKDNKSDGTYEVIVGGVVQEKIPRLQVPFGGCRVQVQGQNRVLRHSSPFVCVKLTSEWQWLVTTDQCSPANSVQVAQMMHVLDGKHHNQLSTFPNICPLEIQSICTFVPSTTYLYTRLGVD